MSPVRVAPRVWLITGASSGFGLELAKVVLEMDELVVGVCRHPEALKTLADAHPSTFLALRCDVTIPSDITAAFAAAIAKFGHVDVVFNSAGSAILGELEATPDDSARALFEVNFWGALAVSKEAVRVFRDVNPAGCGGRLLNVSSGVGFGGVPLTGMYAASKFGSCGGLYRGSSSRNRPCMEYQESFRYPSSALAPSEPACTTTAQSKSPSPLLTTNPTSPSRAVRDWFADDSNIKGDPVAAARRFFRFSNLEKPPMRWAVGMGAVMGVRAKVKWVTEENDLYESWSDGLERSDA
ncbi:NAD-P-binding protein [Mycena kentingensis (nom. inval.)]|nr:NAD-P-binding protein [Mycena kentingensis (nom. inval.)]